MAKTRCMTRPRPGGRGGHVARLVSPLGAGVLVAVAAVVATVAVSASASSSPLASRQPAPAPSHCQRARCVATAEAARAKDFPPASTTIPPASRWVTQSAVVAAARNEAEGAAGKTLARAQAAVLPAAVRRMTIHQFDVSQGLADDAGILPSRIVWVVTVHGHMAEDVPPGHAPVIASVYTDVFDQATGTLIMRAIGVDMSHPRS
jgi:hypothetical protein